MIIDFHTHIFPDSVAERVMNKLSGEESLKPFTKATEKDLVRSGAEAGIDLSVVLPVVTNPERTRQINREVALVNARQKSIFCFGGIHPDNVDYKEALQEIHDLGLKGVKLHPVFQRICMNDIRYLRIIDRAIELGLIIEVHAGRDISMPDAPYALPRQILPVLRMFRPKKMILAHMGSWNDWDAAEELLKEYPDIYVDTAFTLAQSGMVPHRYSPLPAEQFTRMARLVGTDHILFGTDSPWTGQRQAVLDAQALGFSKEDTEKILGENAKRLLEI